MESYEEIFNTQQSPTLILAGPGAGKTHLLADKIKRLIDNEVDKNSISVLTFGTDANQHMINELLNPRGNFNMSYKNLPHEIKTMHALGFKIVQEKPHNVKLNKTNLEVQPDEKVKKLLYRDSSFILGYTEEDSKEAILCKQYGNCQKNLKNIKCKICKKYWEIMSKCNRIDFDDQILFANQILRNNPEILENYQNGAKYLLVDEYQDINNAQFELIELLSRESREGLFVVGDDAQSIYGFRGSDPKFILRFKEDFPNAKIPPLPHSRRCCKQIMDDAIKILEKYYKKWSGRRELHYHQKSGEIPYIFQLPSNTTEARKVASVTKDAVQNDKKVLILAPKKEFFTLISEELSKLNIPHTCPVNLLPTQTDERIKIAKLFIDWVQKYSDNFLTRLAIEELIDKGIARISGSTKSRRCSVDTIKNRIAVETEIAKLWESVDRNNNLFSIIDKYSGTNNTISNIKIGLNKLLNSYINCKENSKGEFVKNLSIVTNIWSKPDKFIYDILAVYNLINNQLIAGSESVKLLTMRKAKGLSADVVIIVGLEDDIVPTPKGDIEEEARLFYVSMTRAKEKLYLLHAYKRPRNISYGQELMAKKRSKFLDVLGRESIYHR